ncbi:hypothetical protein AB4Z01_04000 [Inquilinus sp. YAF38]|uniref:hypothetical protein n=1 Tax=Inquilinus sp. YAF38 TaxID=3233084 RepID=UPI003F924BA7
MTYPGRRLPFAVQRGRPGEALPCHVVRLSNNCIILGGAIVSGVPSEIPFSGEGPAWENEDLFMKLAALNTQGLPFQYQPKQWEAPDALMAWWQETGRLTASFRAISWMGLGRWLITTVEPPVIGVLGWAGPKPFDH